MDHATERVFRQMLGLFVAKDMDGMADLWAPDGTAAFPFAEAGAPTLLEGREAVRDYLVRYPDVYDTTGVSVARVHRTEDPETIIVELSSEGRAVRTGAAYRMDYVQVVTVQDGMIAEIRDYWSPVQVARAGGALEELRKGLEA
ncbi:nuclear transport factor 2 family protein [Spiractinospora alimapuensis]|uniref:nuclear transport factor 2 family protein n=1 Tax=Spiractinospora alimapuensis TaxID=2820884 RepID=UPI001F216C25|nr:nuclear transport factor 2 family protein [Spiractinospora alimapuensis]QVQ51280.1 nuclear transport factor 2 family protein [Spiractinospora alimapuensis]